MIEVEHAAQSLPPYDATGHRRNVARRFNESVREALVIPLSVIVCDILAQQLAKMMLAQRHHFRQALLANRSNRPAAAVWTVE